MDKGKLELQEEQRKLLEDKKINDNKLDGNKKKLKEIDEQIASIKTKKRR